MTGASENIRCEQTDLVLKYALRTLSATEVPVAEAHIRSCPDCQCELDLLRPIASSFASLTQDVLRPARSLWDRLAKRIGAETGGEPAIVACTLGRTSLGDCGARNFLQTARHRYGLRAHHLEGGPASLTTTRSGSCSKLASWESACLTLRICA